MSKDKVTTEVWILETLADKPPLPESKKTIETERHTIIAKLESGQALTIHESIRAARALERVWLPKDEQRALKRQRQLENIEQTLETAKSMRKHHVPLPFEGAAIAYVAKMYGKSVDALKQWRKRGKKTRP